MYERCEGCPIVPKGKKCSLLPSALKEIDLDLPSFLRAEFSCNAVDGGKSGPLGREVVTITKKGAIYGTFGKAAEQIFELFEP